MHKKIYVHDERKMFFDFLHKDNNLSVRESLKELKGLPSLMNLKNINVYYFIFEDKGKNKLSYKIYKNRVQIAENDLNNSTKQFFYRCKNEYSNYLKEVRI